MTQTATQTNKRKKIKAYIIHKQRAMAKKWLYYFLAFIVLLPLYPACKDIFASGVILDSMGAVSSGRGGANIAHADNGVLIHDNPAALVNLPAGKRMDFSLEFIYPEARYEDPQNSDYSTRDLFFLPTFSFIYKKDDESRLAFGIGAYAPAGFSTEYHLEHFASLKTPLRDIPVSFGNQLYRSEAYLLKMLFAASCKVTERLSFGFAVGPAFQSTELEVPYTLQTGPFAGQLSFLADMNGKDHAGFSYTAGAQYKISENTTIGLAFVSESRATLRGDADILLPDSAPGSRVFDNKKAEYDMKANFEWPRSIGLGISHLMGRAHRFSADVVWFNWASAYDRMDLELTDGDNTEFNRALGPKVNDVFPFDWQDAFSLRFGYEYFYKGNKNNVFRLGYIFNEIPIPDDTLVPLIPGVLKHGVTIGYSRKWEKWEAGIASQFGIGGRRSVDSSAIVGNDFDNSSVEARGYFLIFEMAYHFW